MRHPGQRAEVGQTGVIVVIAGAVELQFFQLSHP